MDIFTQSQPCIGRQKVLNRLNRILNAKNRPFHKRVTVLTGLGGIGKTFVVNRYLEKYPQTPAVLIRADTYTTLATDFRQLALKFGIYNANMKECVHEFYKFVSEKEKQLLIIFDNALPSSFSNDNVSSSEDSLEGIQAFLPTRELVRTLNFFPNILITSRIRSWSYGGKALRLLQLKQLTQAERENYLWTHLSPKSLNFEDKSSKDAIHKLAKSFGGYPLTIILSAAYLENVLMSSEYQSKNNVIIFKFLKKLKEHLSRLDKCSEVSYSKLNEKKERYDDILSFIWRASLSAISLHENGKGVQFYMATISVFYPFENWFRFTVPTDKLETFKLLEKFALVPPTRKTTPVNYVFARVTVNSKHLSKQLVRFMQSDVLDHPEHVFINNHPITWMFLDFCWQLHSGLKNLGWPGMGFRISNLFLLNLLVNTTDRDRWLDQSEVIKSIAHVVIKDLSDHEERLSSRERNLHEIDISVRKIVSIIWDIICGKNESVTDGQGTSLELEAENNLSKCLEIMMDHKDVTLIQVFGAKVVHALYVETSIQYSKEVLTKLSNWVTKVLIISANKFDSYYRFPSDKFARIHRIAFKLTEESEEHVPLQTLFSLYFQQLDQEMNDDSPFAYRYWQLLCGYVKEKKLFWNFPILSRSFRFEKSESAEKETIYRFVTANEASDISSYDDLADVDDVLSKVNIFNDEFDLQNLSNQTKRVQFLEAGGLLMLIKGLGLCVDRKKFAHLMKICEITQELCRCEVSRRRLQKSEDFLLTLENALICTQFEHASLIERSVLVVLVSTAYAISLATEGKDRVTSNENSVDSLYANVLRVSYNQILKTEKSCPHATLLYITSNETKYT
ncbi:unnamed protein product [Allacma fusca]|uniref:ORC1/DEAH AAA+ ATPase domain-containing protein n=1 Tax=Allacma fusca TaxID=39272 RepID=A0A8J2NLD0_9HEXA|nr:unnamed protein product [Allacma fusca]